MKKLLTPDQMAIADRLSIEKGAFSGFQLMRNAGHAVAAEILARYPENQRFIVLAGPGNNGGDGYVVAELLAQTGADVRLFALGTPKKGTDAHLARAECSVRAAALDDFDPKRGDLIVDALFGAGLDREITGPPLAAINKTRQAGCTVVAIDLPSGVSGKSGRVLGGAFQAALTVTFFRKKPGHLLYPGKRLCGRTVVADIGIRQDVLDDIAVNCFENVPGLWRGELPDHDAQTHKYARGALAVCSGGPSSTGAARLSALAAAKSGAGAVTVLSPPAAVIVNAAHLTSIMLAAIAEADDLTKFLSNGKTASAVIGPGFGTGKRLRDFALALLAPGLSEGSDDRGLKGLVLDADALTEFADDRQTLFDAVAAAPQSVIMTPHEGEFARLFPDLVTDGGFSKVDRAVQAARTSNAVVLLKGPDTVIASPDGRAAINTNGNINLAVAGSGDVLSGIAASLVAQGMKAWPAACAAAWIHGEAGRIAGFGAMAEDLAHSIPHAIGDLIGA